MKAFVLLTGLLCFVALSAGTSNPPPVNVTVYYEALCPHSISFFNDQLTPHYHTFKTYMNLRLVPFGLANHTQTAQGDWVSICRHGEVECDGHKIQACAISNIADNDKLFDFISCLMANGTRVKPYPGNECAENVDVYYNDTLDCTITGDADKLLADLQDSTNQVTPAITSVPVVVFNSVFKTSDQKLALTDFANALCSYIEPTIRPTACSIPLRAPTHTNSAVIREATLALIAVGGFFTTRF